MKLREQCRWKCTQRVNLCLLYISMGRWRRKKISKENRGLISKTRDCDDKKNWYEANPNFIMKKKKKIKNERSKNFRGEESKTEI